MTLVAERMASPSKSPIEFGELVLVGAELRLEIDLDAAILEDLDGGGRQSVGDEDLGGHAMMFTPLSRSASLLLAKAQSSHSVSASTSARSTVEPHQMRRPGGASR